MPKLLILLLLTFYIGTNSVSAQHFHQLDSVSRSDTTTFTLKELRYGRVTTEKLRSLPANSPSGTRSITTKHIYTDLTDTISAKLGVNFGVELIMNSKSHVNVPLTIVWKFPDVMTNKLNQTFTKVSHTSYFHTNHLLNFSYRFDHDYEVMPGVWEFQIFHRNTLLYSKEFFLMLEL